MIEQKLTGYPSIDKPWLKYYSEEAVNAVLPECTVYHNIWNHNKAFLNDIALEFYGRRFSFRKLFQEVEKCVKSLKHSGIKSGDRITLCVSCVPEAVYLVLACSKLGVLANFVNPMFTAEQLIDCINKTGSEHLFVLDAMYSYISDVIDQTCITHVIVIPAANSLPLFLRTAAKLKSSKSDSLQKLTRDMHKAGYSFWNQFIKAGVSCSGSPEEAYARNTPLVMVYSSGTTGSPKGIVLTNDSINATLVMEQKTLEISRNRKYLCIVPIWFSTGISLSILAPLSVGSCVLLEPVFSRETFAKGIFKYRPTYFVGTASLWSYAIECGKLKNADLSFIECPLSGGEQMPQQLEEKINAFLTEHGCKSKLFKGWGQCELGGTVTLSRGPDGKAGDVGIPLSLVTVAAFDPETDMEIPYDRYGELRVLSPAHMLEYYENAVETNTFFHSDKLGNRWACTGDIGSIDSNGNIFIFGRANDSFLTENGSRVYLFDIENVILKDKAVKQCEVVAITISGSEKPVAHIVLEKNNSEDVSAVIQRINIICKQQLPIAAVPYLYKIRKSFELNATSNKRDVEVLKNEHDGFVDAKGDSAIL